MYKQTRLHFLLILLVTYLGTNLLVRAVFMLHFSPDISFSPVRLAQIFVYGAINDICVFACLTLPLALAVLFLPWRGRVAHAGAFTVFTLYLALFLFTAVSEYFFWDEFNVRFNFIAVDYLIYTQEVIANIMESYPVIPLLCVIAGLSLLLAAMLLRPLRHARQMRMSGKLRLSVGGLWIILTCFALFVFTPPAVSPNTFENELSHNGIWSLFYAFFHNQLDYRAFYPVLDSAEALSLVRSDLMEPAARFVSDDSNDLSREIHGTGREKRYNVIQIVIESLGSDSLNDRTPNINRLREQSLYFANMRATGTRTVRGIEALTLSIPPTPGNSIVRRPNCGAFLPQEPFSGSMAMIRPSFTEDTATLTT